MTAVAGRLSAVTVLVKLATLWRRLSRPSVDTSISCAKCCRAACQNGWTTNSLQFIRRDASLVSRPSSRFWNSGDGFDETRDPMNSNNCNNTHNESSTAFFSKLGRKIASISGDNREPSFLFQRISITVQRFNSIMLHNSFSTDEEWPLQLFVLLLTLFLTLGIFTLKGIKKFFLIKIKNKS